MAESSLGIDDTVLDQQNSLLLTVSQVSITKTRWFYQGKYLFELPNFVCLFAADDISHRKRKASKNVLWRYFRAELFWLVSQIKVIGLEGFKNYSISCYEKTGRSNTCHTRRHARRHASTFICFASFASFPSDFRANERLSVVYFTIKDSWFTEFALMPPQEKVGMDAYLKANPCKTKIPKGRTLQKGEIDALTGNCP